MRKELTCSQNHDGEKFRGTAIKKKLPDSVESAWYCFYCGTRVDKQEDFITAEKARG